MTIAASSGTNFVSINTFTAPVAGNYWLDAGLDVLFAGPVLGPVGEVECRWTGPGVTGPRYNESLTLGFNFFGLTIPGAPRASFAVNAQAIDLVAGGVATLQCRSLSLLTAGTSLTVEAVAAGMQVS